MINLQIVHPRLKPNFIGSKLPNGGILRRPQAQHATAPVAGFTGALYTGGAPGTLRTGGLYRYSRNPQYLADIGIIVGWSLLAAATSTFMVAVPAIIALITAPFAEEHWLRERYGSAFDVYAARTPRFF